jgi:hypothetical protein
MKERHMPYIASDPQKFLGTSVGNGQCVAFARAAAAVGHTQTWKRGVQVRGATIAPGTAIATFDQDGKYENDTHGRSHAAIYLGQDAVGILVLDQWVERTSMPDGRVQERIQPVHERRIRFQDNARAVNDGRNYYVID